MSLKFAAFRGARYGSIIVSSDTLSKFFPRQSQSCLEHLTFRGHFGQSLARGCQDWGSGVELVKIAILAAAIPWIVPAHGHSWYPKECCAETHCHVTDRVRELPDGSAEVQVGSETIVVYRWLKRRTSPDGHYHLCYSKWDKVPVVYCFFEPAQA